MNYEELDPEVISLVKAMNLFPGIITVESCCGHNKQEFAIYFEADSFEALPPLLYWFDGCHSGVYGWKVEVFTDCGMKPAVFEAHSTAKGKQAYEEADKIASKMTDYLAEE